jgi:hypothetical protein
MVGLVGGASRALIEDATRSDSNLVRKGVPKSHEAGIQETHER